jgi:hypothetical protein
MVCCYQAEAIVECIEMPQNQENPIQGNRDDGEYRDYRC